MDADRRDRSDEVAEREDPIFHDASPGVKEDPPSPDTAVEHAIGAALPGAVGGLTGGAGVGASVDNRDTYADLPDKEHSEDEPAGGRPA